MVDLELYRVFCIVARSGSLTKAAQELYISQPAVSQAIRQLERQIGMPLFQRTRRGMKLTAQGGELIYGEVEQAVRALEGVEERIAALRNTATGTLRIGASATIFRYVLSEKIVEYHRRYPQVKIELLTDISPRTVEQLKTDRCDVGFLNLPIEADDDIRITGTVQLLSDIFVAGEAFSALKGQTLSVWDLERYPLLLMEENTVARAAVRHYAESLGATLSPAVEVDSWGFMKQLVAGGMGIGCIPREYARHQLGEGTLFELDVRPAMPTRSVGIALPKSGVQSFALRSFLALFS